MCGHKAKIKENNRLLTLKYEFRIISLFSFFGSLLLWLKQPGILKIIQIFFKISKQEIYGSAIWNTLLYSPDKVIFASTLMNLQRSLLLMYLLYL